MYDIFCCLIYNGYDDISGPWTMDHMSGKGHTIGKMKKETSDKETLKTKIIQTSNFPTWSLSSIPMVLVDRSVIMYNTCVSQHYSLLHTQHYRITLKHNHNG